METKYDLKCMLREIQEDEKVAPQSTQTISQQEIRGRISRKRKEKRNER